LLQRRWFGDLRKGRPIDSIIDEVAAQFRAASGEERRWLISPFVTFLVIALRAPEAVQIVDEMMEQFPDDVRLPMEKATLYLYSLKDPDKALPCIDLALQRAHRTGLFRREALGVKARILVELGQGEQLSEVLEEIMSMQMMKGVADVGRERDFIDRAPPGLIPEDVLARYNQFRRKRAGDGIGNEPPEYEPAEWEC
jgi:hypothetical protein